jgi:hypothetical protein
VLDDDLLAERVRRPASVAVVPSAAGGGETEDCAREEEPGVPHEVAGPWRTRRMRYDSLVKQPIVLEREPTPADLDACSASGSSERSYGGSSSPSC